MSVVLAGVAMVSVDGHPQFVCPAWIQHGDGVEGGDGGRQLRAAATQNGNEAALGPRRLLDGVLQLIATPLNTVVVRGHHRYHLVG